MTDFFRLLLQRKCACDGSAGTNDQYSEYGSKRRLQAKLSIGASNDPMEQEADRAADQVLAAPVHPAVNTAPNIQPYTGQASNVAGHRASQRVSGTCERWQVFGIRLAAGYGTTLWL